MKVTKGTVLLTALCVFGAIMAGRFAYKKYLGKPSPAAVAKDIGNAKGRQDEAVSKSAPAENATATKKALAARKKEAEKTALKKLEDGFGSLFNKKLGDKFDGESRTDEVTRKIIGDFTPQKKFLDFADYHVELMNDKRIVRIYTSLPFDKAKLRAAEELYKNVRKLLRKKFPNCYISVQWSAKEDASQVVLTPLPGHPESDLPVQPPSDMKMLRWKKIEYKPFEQSRKQLALSLSQEDSCYRVTLEMQDTVLSEKAEKESEKRLLPNEKDAIDAL